MRRLAALFLIAVFSAAGPAAAFADTVIAQISLSAQTMRVSVNGEPQYTWKVSTARRGYRTPTGIFTARWASRYHRSRKYDNAPMPYAIFFKGGYAIHGTYEVRSLGRPVSHGCVRLHPDNAAIFFALATSNGLANTKVIIAR
ncbi:L,D-transpeptidase [Ciceribacter ferrooxidans]|uniref:L,D-transpeptidase n=1 Tax=Ciceribacter ferrooxidans TaxID=2509717 RepID=A0A4Q2T1P4_9HYPH|nr:L,D-transpeptidase [Ciceribacter ferrooxidans]RYC12352.1 L,D-transpeptidase [Ciceribacter ferrooxidans]